MKKLLSHLLQTIVQPPGLQSEAAAVFLADPSAHRFELVAQHGLDPRFQRRWAHLDLGHGPSEEVVEEGSFPVAQLAERLEIHSPEVDDSGRYLIPLRDGRHLLGMLALWGRASPPGRGEREILEGLAEVVALVVRQYRDQRDKVLAELVVQHSTHGVMIADEEKRILWVNPAFEKTTGYTLAEVRGQTPRILSSGRHGPEFYHRMWRAIEESGQWEGEIWNRRKNGQIYPEWLNIVALRNADGRIERYAGIFIDLTEIRQAEEYIHRLAYFDELTGLPNRAHFSRKLAERLEEDGENGETTVILLDLDHFHEVNAALGREAGDSLLKEAARRLCGAVEGGWVARGEVDQFLVAVVTPPHSSAREVVEACLQNLHAALQDPLDYNGQSLELSASMGIAKGRPGDSVEDLLGRAALALRRAKEAQRRGVCWFDERLGQEAARDHHILLNIGGAVRRGELFLVYQPQLDQRGELVGAEALLRWDSPPFGLIPPDLFIRRAEERGAIGEIGRWVFQAAASQLAEWREAGLLPGRDFTLAINFSPAQLLGEDVVEEFVQIAAYHHLPPESFELELTETALMQSSENAREKLEGLVAAGFRIAIDDFGTGYSSLARLCSFPIHTFKVDRSFIERIAEGGRHLALVKSLIAMAQELGYAVVAEGVEHEEQFVLLKDLGCEQFQGYWFSRPLPASRFAAYAGTRAGWD